MALLLATILPSILIILFFVYSDKFKEQTFVFIPTRRLKKLVKDNYYVVKKGGDNWTSKGYIVPKEDLLKLI